MLKRTLLILLLIIIPTLAQNPSQIRKVPMWEIDEAFKKDIFTFVRIEYSSTGRTWPWDTDYPDSDLNFSFRLQELTSMKVNPIGRSMRLTNPDLFEYPFIYLIEPGDMVLTPQERKALNRYLLNGGFMMVDDFWGDSDWRNFAREMNLVFPNRKIVDLTIDHPIFHAVYDFDEFPQNANHQNEARGLSWEPRSGESARHVHYRAIYDDYGRIMTIICHNTDLGDGWEREGDNIEFFEEVSIKKAYPMGINIVFYAMTH